MLLNRYIAYRMATATSVTLIMYLEDRAQHPSDFAANTRVHPDHATKAYHGVVEL